MTEAPRYDISMEDTNMFEKQDEPKRVRRIEPAIRPEQLGQDLEALIGMAGELGATDATIIEASDVVFRREVLDRVGADDDYPSAHWPLRYPRDDVKEAVRAYQKGIFFRVNSGPGMQPYGGGPIADLSHRRLFTKVYEIVARLESESFYMGYHLVLGFAAGNCRAVFCAEEKSCHALTKGKKCVRPYRGRPSMEAAGLDTAAMAHALKWNLLEKNDAPLLAGLVMGA